MPSSLLQTEVPPIRTGSKELRQSPCVIIQSYQTDRRDLLPWPCADRHTLPITLKVHLHEIFHFKLVWPKEPI
jgi:hypothetical protein